MQENGHHGRGAPHPSNPFDDDNILYDDPPLGDDAASWNCFRGGTATSRPDNGQYGEDYPEGLHHSHSAHGRKSVQTYGH